MKRQPIRVFCDFDGTISAKDVGASLFNHFSGKRNQGTVGLWIDQKIDSRECLLRECAYLRASREEMIAALKRIELRDGFREFAGLLAKQKIPLHVVSDGLDFYIEAFFEKAGVTGIDIHSNRACFVNGRLYPVFPHYTSGCGFCGACKGERIRALRRDGELAVFIGDGYSDRCAVGEADILFASDDLVRIAREKGVDWVDFKDFFEIADYFQENLLNYRD